MRWRTISLLAPGSRATVSPRVITSRDTTGRRSASLEVAAGFPAQGLPFPTGISRSRNTSICLSHPPPNSPQNKTEAPPTDPLPIPFIFSPLHPPPHAHPPPPQ